MDATLQGKEGSDSGEQSVGARCVKEACKSLALNGLHKLSVLKGLRYTEPPVCFCQQAGKC